MSPHGTAPLPEFELVTVASGASTLRCRSSSETFHPGIGPIAEAEALHVRQQRLAERARSEQDFTVWDIGLGAAANAVAAIAALRDNPSPVELHSFEQTLSPLHFALTHRGELNYPEMHVDTFQALISHGEASVGSVRWILHLGDFRSMVRERSLPRPSAILYDPYSPATNPDLWTVEHFQSLHRQLDPERRCSLTSYSRSTAVRVTLLMAGFFVGRGVALGEKTETTLAANTPDLLPALLEKDWLQRVRRSTKSAPLRSGAPGGPISPGDFDLLSCHPQFR